MEIPITPKLLGLIILSVLFCLEEVMVKEIIQTTRRSRRLQTTLPPPPAVPPSLSASDLALIAPNVALYLG